MKTWVERTTASGELGISQSDFKDRCVEQCLWVQEHLSNALLSRLAVGNIEPSKRKREENGDEDREKGPAYKKSR